jgi:hypothetical protein
MEPRGNQGGWFNLHVKLELDLGVGSKWGRN